MIPYTTVDGEEVEIKKTIVDAGYRTKTVYHFCTQAGLGVEPAMGFGKSAGCAQASFRPPARVSDTKRPGDGWFRSLQSGGVWLVGMDKDRWLGFEHDRYLTPPDMPGTCLLFGTPGNGDRMSGDQKAHMSFSKHLTAIVEREEPTKNGIVRRWHSKSDCDHYFDASYMASVAGNICGVSLLMKINKNQGGARPSMGDLAGRK